MMNATEALLSTGGRIGYEDLLMGVIRDEELFSNHVEVQVKEIKQTYLMF